MAHFHFNDLPLEHVVRLPLRKKACQRGHPGKFPYVSLCFPMFPWLNLLKCRVFRPGGYVTMTKAPGYGLTVWMNLVEPTPIESSLSQQDMAPKIAFP